MIVVEGPDGAGKTTLVNALCKDLGLHKSVSVTGQEGPGWPRLKDRRHRDRELPRFPRERTYEALAHAVAGDPVHIHDRLFWSEAIYGPMLRGESKFTIEEEFRIMRLFKALRCPVIFVEAIRNTVLDEQEKNPPQLEGWNIGKAAVIWEKYLDAADVAFTLGLNVRIYEREPLRRTPRAPINEYAELRGWLEKYLERRREWTV